ncbi:hypothetical protein [Erythrobacter longus]|uniref:hypothetical protein n=1 Tax=Erythrobacter longus TaxID=1044 RepID=UPI000A6B1E0A|nr:hypothetical protein [Erythrobacter longus]
MLGITGLGASFFEIEESLVVLQQDLPMIEWTRDYVIVANFSLFTIVLIPVMAVWCFASRIARLIMAVMCVLPILALGSALFIGLRDDDLLFGLVVDPALTIFATVILYLPSSSRWLSQERSLDPTVFK